MTIARKCLSIEDKFNDEVRILNLLRSSQSKHLRIMTHLGTLIHGDRFNIFFPWADMDLREFIYEERVDHLGMKPIHLLEEASHLADALAFLHNGITIPGGSQVCCVHMDLKPENIVVIFNQKSPAGIWMITDFGISKIKPSSDDQTAHGVASEGLLALNYVGDATTNFTRTVPNRKPGPFQAPEVQNTTARGVGRKSDIWSLGCIFGLVLARGEGRNMVSRFDKERSRDGGPTDYFYKEADARSAPRTGVTWEVKNNVLNWLDALAENSNLQKYWVHDFVDLVKRMIVIEMDERPDARKVHADLETILEKSKAAGSSPSSKEPLKRLSSRNTKLMYPLEHFQQPSTQHPASSAEPFVSSVGSTPPQGNSGESSLSTSPSIASILESGLVKLELPPGKILRTIFSPAGGLVAFLSETHIFLYATQGLDWNKKLGDVIRLSALSGLEIRNGTNGKWRSASLSGSYLLLRGLLGVALYELRPLNLIESVEIPIHDCPDLSKLEEAEVSCRGHIVLRYTDHLIIWHRETSTQAAHVHSLTISGRLKAASFSSDGNFLYAWACGSGPNQWYIWEVHTETPIPVCSGHYDSERVGSPIEELLPLADTAAFIIRENQGRLSIAQSDSTSSKPAYFSKLLSGIIMCTYSPGCNALVLVRSSSKFFRRNRVEMLRLNSAHDGSRRFAPSIQELGNFTYRSRDMTRSGIAVTKTGAAESLRILISHPDGVLESLIFRGC